jgi:hypothetical protein
MLTPPLKRRSNMREPIHISIPFKCRGIQIDKYKKWLFSFHISKEPNTGYILWDLNIGPFTIWY